MNPWPSGAITLSSSPAHPREDLGAFADGFVEDGKSVACDLEDAERPPQQRVLHRQHADMGELSRLDERRDLRRAQHETEIRIGIALVGNNLDGLFKHWRLPAWSAAANLSTLWCVYRPSSALPR